MIDNKPRGQDHSLQSTGPARNGGSRDSSSNGKTAEAVLKGPPPWQPSIRSWLIDGVSTGGL